MRLRDFFDGYVIFDAVGGFSERFLNLCRMRGIDIRNVKVSTGRIRGQVNRKKLKSVEKIAESSGAKIEIAERRGFPSLLQRKKHRLALVVGVAVVLCAMLLMNNFVWCIECVGSERYSPEQIIAVAQQSGLNFGTFIPAFDETQAARNIVTAFGGTLQWGAINIKGSMAVIEVRDFTDELEPYSGDEPCNIVADADGVILSLEAQRGVPVALKGSAVSKGDVLISGAVEKTDMSVYFTHAKGNVTAITQRSISEAVSDKKRQVYTDCHSYYVLELFSLRIPLGFYKSDNPYHTFEEETFCSMKGTRLPFSVTKVTVTELARGDTESLTETLSRYCEKEYTEFANSHILSCEVSFKGSGSALTIEGEYSCIDFIGKKQAIIIENG